MHNGPTLEVSLEAITRNYKLLAGKLGSGTCAAVVKADAYGLGAARVAPALAQAGCRAFFVATLQEGINLQEILGAQGLGGPDVYVFHGCRKSEVAEFDANNLIPVLNSLAQIEAWGNAGPAALHIDTGMNRLGIAPDEVEKVAKGGWALVMSHLACGSEPDHPMNKKQLEAFRKTRGHFAGVPASLANSSGVFLGSDYHFDLARPGCSLYGITPNPAKPNPVENVVTLSAPVLQYRQLKKAEGVGYGVTYEAKAGSVLATVEIGYADGFLRALSNKTQGYAAGVRVPLAGRVSMDMLIFDVTAVPEAKRTTDLRITLIGKEQPVDEVAHAADTIGYEIFTRIGSRVRREYKGVGSGV